MTDILTVLPDLDIAPHAHLLPSLERAHICTADLLSLDPAHLAKRAQVPLGDVKALTDAVVSALHYGLKSRHGLCAEGRGEEEGKDGEETFSNVMDNSSAISTLDDRLDAALGGGVALGHITEVVGESGAGKTQCLLTLLLSAQLTPVTDGRSEASALYISTEAPLQTSRLSQILLTHPKLAVLSSSARPSLNRIHSIQVHDVEAQDHILHYQVPVAIVKHSVRLLVIDSIAANFRAEFDRDGRARKNADLLAKRSQQLGYTAAFLRYLARTHNVAVVVANQVSDRFILERLNATQSQAVLSARPNSPNQLVDRTTALMQPMILTRVQPGVLLTDDPLALDHQQRFFTGWGDNMTTTDWKTPSLGLAWTNQLSTRLALLKEPVYETKVHQPRDELNVIDWRRICKVVFSAWCPKSIIEFEIWAGGIRSTM